MDQPGHRSDRLGLGKAFRQVGQPVRIDEHVIVGKGQNVTGGDADAPIVSGGQPTLVLPDIPDRGTREFRRDQSGGGIGLRVVVDHDDVEIRILRAQDRFQGSAGVPAAAPSWR